MPTVSIKHGSIHYRFISIAVAGCLGAALSCLASATAAADPSIEELEEQVDTASQELEIIVEEYNQVVEDLKDLEEQHRETGDALSPLQQRAADSEVEVGTLASELYTAGPAMTVTPFLTGNPEVLAQRLVILDYIGQDRTMRLSEVQNVTDDLASEQTAIDELSQERDALKAEKADKAAEVTSSLADLEDIRAQAMGQGYQDERGLTAPPIPGNSSAAATTAVQFAHDALGTPYQWGGSGPDGYDCSGLTSAAWAAAGVDLPHNAAAQYDSTARVSRGELQPGDLVFYYTDLHHVGIYVGEDKIIHSPNAGQTVRVASVDSAPVQGYGRPG